MNVIKASIVALVGGLVVAAPATAQTYDAFTSFNGTQGAGNFIYGEANMADPGASGVLFTANTNCFISNSVCLQLAPNFDVPGFTKGGSPDFQYGTVNVPNDRLLGHPDDDSDLTFIAFVAPTAGLYSLSATFNIQDINPTGVDIFQITTTNGGLPLIFAPLSSINAQNTTFSFSLTKFFTASEAFGFGLGNGGDYRNDSTGVNFSATAVPEPATWAMLLIGFGAVGYSLRSRKVGYKAAQAV